VHRFAHLIAPFTDVFYYKFTYVGRFSFFRHPGTLPYGVHHTDDLQYIIWINFISPLFTPSDPEHVIVERFTRIWQNFAESGNPNNSGDEFLASLNWNKLDLQLENYLDFGNHMIEKNGLFLERFRLWDEFDDGQN
jgi:carboxylesterase type B